MICSSAALEAEGIPCDGRFYEPVYRSDLFYATPENCPQLASAARRPVDYSAFHCPVSERAAYEEGGVAAAIPADWRRSGRRRYRRAVAKVMSEPRGTRGTADPALAGDLSAWAARSGSRHERQKNY